MGLLRRNRSGYTTGVNLFFVKTFLELLEP